MDTRMFARGSVKSLQFLLLMLVCFIIPEHLAQAAPVIVSVDHRVSVSYSKPQFDASKGIYMTQVRIGNRSAASLLSPLRLTLDQFDGQNVMPVNPTYSEKGAQPAFEFVLPKGVLATGSSTKPLKVFFSVGNNKNTGSAMKRESIKTRLAGLTYHVEAGADSALLVPSAYPDALPVNSGKFRVLFGVPFIGKAKPSAPVYLRRAGDRNGVAMNDIGKDGDSIANDGTYSVIVQIDTDKTMPDSCLLYETYTRLGRAEFVSPPVRLCVSSFPVVPAKSNTTDAVTLPDGTKAVADEVLLFADRSTSAATIRELARSIQANVAGTILSLNLYQLKLPAPVSASRLLEIVAQLGAKNETVKVSVNGIGRGALDVNDTAFDLPPANIDSQHGLKQVLGHVDATNANAWDSGGTGSGVTVVVLDTGLTPSHPDLTVSPCLAVPDQTPPASDPTPLSIPCADTLVGTTPAGHGTQVAGIIAATTNNNIGVAGVAFGSNIKSIKMRDWDHVEMMHGFKTVEKYITLSNPNAKIVNASFYGQWDPASWVYSAGLTALCTSIESVVWNGAARAVVVNAVGNDDNKDPPISGPTYTENFYPARCNDSTSAVHAGLTHKELLITVSNSVSKTVAACGAALVNERCNTSNYGSWVDIAAPGSAIRSTTIGNTYATSTGTSFSAPFVSGAAAILASCGVPLQSIQSALTSSATVKVPYPGSTITPVDTRTPRLDIYRALHRFAPTATNTSAAETYIEDTPRNLTNIVVTDSDGCANVTATLTVPPGAGTLTGGVTTWTMSGPVASVNTALAALTFSPTSNYNSTFNITTSVSDGFSPTLTGTKVMTGTAVNDAPGFVAGANQTVSEDAGAQTVVGWATAISKGPANEAAQTLTFSTSNTNNALFSTQPAISPSGTLTYTPAANANGAATVTVVLTDNGGVLTGGVNTSAAQTFTIDVTPVNDAPSFVAGANQTVSEDAGAQTVVGWATAISKGPANEAVQTLSFSTSNTNNVLFSTQPAINPSGELTYTPAANANGTATVTVVLTDNGGGANASAAQTFTIEVTPVNDAPSFVAGANQTVSEDAGAQTVVGWATAISKGPADEAAQTLTFSTSNTNNALFSTQPEISPSGELTYTPTANANGTATVTVVLTDNGGGANASAAQTFTIEVTPQNDAPTILNQPIEFSHIEFNQIANAWPSGVDDFVGIVNASDPDGDTLTYSIDPAGNFADVNGVTQVDAFRFDAASPPDPFTRQLMINNLLAVNFEYKPVFNLPVQVTDAGGLSASANVTVTLTNDANDNGDPHITTVRGLRYDFQSAGEFVALRGANGMEIQTRQTAIPGPAPFTDPYSGLAVGVSINTAVAARVGDFRVTYQPNASGVPELRINGNVTTLPANGVDLGVGGRVIPLGANSIQVDFPDGTVMTVSAYLWGSLSYMQIGVMHTPAREGLMGINTAGSWLPRLADGTSFGAMPSALCDRFVELYEKFADSWRVTDDTSLFYYAPGTSTSTFTSVWPLEKPLCAAPSIVATPRPTTVAVAAPVRRIAPVAPRGIVLKPVTKQVAQQHCRTIAGKNEKANCIFDVMFTGNTGFARAYQRTEKLRAGLTTVVVRAEDKLNVRGELVVSATVVRHAAVVPKEKGIRTVPAGTIQFMLGDKTLGKPVRLDAKGQARVVVTRQDMERFNAGKLEITAQYLPAKDRANVFLPSISKRLTRELLPAAMRAGAIVDIPRRLK